METARRNPVGRLTLAVLSLCVVIFVYGLFADRLAPYTPQAVVQAYVVGIAPEIAGRVVEVEVEDNQRVAAGQLLFRIDSEPYRIAVEQAEAKLAAVGQTIGASTASVATAEAAVAEASARAANVREQARRVFELVRKDVYPAARADQATAQLKEAEASVEQARSELERARQNLGPRGQNNPQLREAMAVLQQARLNLVRTQVNAPADGLVTNLQLTIGQYASAGQAIMTFIDLGDYWVSAAFRENSLGRITPGDRAEIVFDALPGRTYPAFVANIGWGVARSGQTGPGGEMPTISNQKGWIRDPQRFPVRLTVATATVPKGIRYNSQANVIVYADDNPVTRAIGWLWIRLVSLLTYAT